MKIQSEAVFLVVVATVFFLNRVCAIRTSPYNPTKKELSHIWLNYAM